MTVKRRKSQEWKKRERGEEVEEKLEKKEQNNLEGKNEQIILKQHVKRAF